MIIGICGAAGAGKDTVALRLNGHGFFRVAFADPLYEMVSAMTGLSVAELSDRDAKEREIDWIGVSPRRLLQSLGTEWGRQHVAEDVWIRLALRTARVASRAVIPDVRFDNEAQAIRAAGGSVWRVVRPGVSCLDSSTAQHSSERGIAPELIDDVILNDGDIERLYGRVDEAIQKATARYN
jgi:cytidylate kinase